VFDEETVVKELALLLEEEEGDKITEEDLEDFEVEFNPSSFDSWSVDHYEVRIWDREYIVLEDEDKAFKLAEEYVKEDLENEPELFNQDWLQGCMNDRIEGKSFIEHASEQAVSIDGFAHFLGHYDGDYQETKSGFIVIRRN